MRNQRRRQQQEGKASHVLLSKSILIRIECRIQRSTDELKVVPKIAGISPCLQLCWLGLGKAGTPEGLRGTSSGLMQQAKRQNNATLVSVI